MAEYIVSRKRLEGNARVLRGVADVANCRVVLALKAFSMWHVFPWLAPYLDGCCASGLHEAELAHEKWMSLCGTDATPVGIREPSILVYAPAYPPADMPRLLEIATHLDFNSVSQWQSFKQQVMTHPRYLAGELHVGLRINPQCSTGHTGMYDPCVPGSRLGIVADLITQEVLEGISTLHFHTLCEQGAEDLATTLVAVEQKFGHLLVLPQITTLNMGGGHWITKPDYSRQILVAEIQRIQAKYKVQVWLEPGEAVAIHTGVLRANVLDVFESEGFHHAILDISATAHTPDVLEMPYRPDVFAVRTNDTACTDASPAVVMEGECYELGAQAGNLPYTYRLGAPTCLAGDVFGDYSWSAPLQVGDVLVFDDMAHYTMVKTSHFNGVAHPNIVVQHPTGELQPIRTFSYKDFANRLS